MLQFLFSFIIILIFFIILLLALPYHYAFNFKFKNNLKYSFSCSLLFLHLIFSVDSDEQFFLIKIFNYEKELDLDNNKIPGFIEDKSKKIFKEKIMNKKAADKKETPTKSKNDSKNKSKFNFDCSLINKKNLNHIFKFTIKMIKNLKMDYLNLNIVFSFGDPYYNGIFLAYYYTLKEILDFPNINAQINWQEVVFEAEGSTGGKIIPLKIIFYILKFALSIRSLKIFWQLYQSNSKKG